MLDKFYPEMKKPSYSSEYLQEMMFGTKLKPLKKTINKKTDKCPVCEGNGRRRDQVTLEERDCVACNGVGRITHRV